MRRDDAYHHPMSHDDYLYKRVLETLGAIRPKAIRANKRGLPELHGQAQRGEQTIKIAETVYFRASRRTLREECALFATFFGKTLPSTAALGLGFADLVIIARNSLPIKLMQILDCIARLVWPELSQYFASSPLRLASVRIQIARREAWCTAFPLSLARVCGFDDQTYGRLTLQSAGGQ